MNVSERLATMALATSLLSLGVSVYVAYDQRARDVSSRARNVVAYEPHGSDDIQGKLVEDYWIDNYDSHPIVAVTLVWPGTGARQLLMSTPILAPCMRLRALSSVADKPGLLQNVTAENINFYDSVVYFWDSDGEAWTITGQTGKHHRLDPADASSIEQMIEDSNPTPLAAPEPIKGCGS
ncbi:hypothetical protein [Symbioplanes lichenis]|uniref:hypothetical protein n=1 Tax=Symbioplanes lichenis TaxID=1629072 RepID=UPI00273A17A3|nr:hypothetical protein [Actinoplanes lichenis]